jgi:hypothetical protein
MSGAFDHVNNHIYRASFALMLGKKDLVARFMSLAMKSRTIHKKRNPK